MTSQPILGAGTPQPTPPPPPFVEDPAVDIINADGTVLHLNNPYDPIYLQPGPTGHGMPVYGMSWAATPGRHGAVLTGVRGGLRHLAYPVFVKGATYAELRDRLRVMGGLLNPTRGPVTIRVMQQDTTGRAIDAIYAGGLEGDEGRDVAGHWYRKLVLTFETGMTFWYDLFTRTQAWRVGGSHNLYPLTWSNFYWSSAQILGTVTEVNPGDADGDPVWTVNGPFTAVTLANVTTGKSLTLTHTLSAGQYVTIDARPGVNTITDQAGANLWPFMAPSPVLWKIAPGANILTLTVTGATAASQVRLDYVPRYQMS